jgi:hypothetical protein
VRILVAAILAMLCGALPSGAQESSTPESPPASFSSSLKDIGLKVVEVFQRPLHPVVKSVGPGGGFGAGLAYSPKQRANEPWSLRLEAVVTPRRYWNAEGSAWLTTERIHVEGYARAREMTRLDFYGLGTDSQRSNRTTFRYSDRTVGGLMSIPLRVSRAGVRLGGRVEALFPHVGSGRHPDQPSIESLFSDSDAPGLLRQPTFAAYTAFAILQFPDDLNQLARLGFDLRASYTVFKDQADGEFDFSRLTVEAQQRLPGLRPSDKLTLHQIFSSASATAGHRVPFYLQNTLGGNGEVRSFNDQVIGSDSTKATLRGFRNLRFRSPHLLLLQAEYRRKLYGPLDATLFVDAGAVSARRSSLALSGMKHNYGFSVSVMTGDATAIRTDVGFGGREGAHVFFSVGPIFQQ